MIFLLLLGIALGALSVVFILQNTAIVTVTFITWQLQGSLAVILFLAIASGILITLLILLPSFIGDVLALRTLRRQKKALEDELADAKNNMVTVTTGEPITPSNVI